jgi:hypothetical protein
VVEKQVMSDSNNAPIQYTPALSFVCGMGSLSHVEPFAGSSVATVPLATSFSGPTGEMDPGVAGGQNVLLAGLGPGVVAAP